MAPFSKAVCLLFSLVIASEVVRAADDHRYHSEDMGPCQTCKVFVESFTKGVHRTRDLPTKPDRLTNIWQDLCEEPRSRTKCLETVRAAWPHVEQWWQPNAMDVPDFFEYICIDKLEVCCPKGHYGRSCLPCAGCGRGRCRGDGTRKGNGTCLCDAGFGGALCQDCVTGYYKSEEDTGFECKRCHYSCSGGCRGGTSRDCVACRSGFTLEPDEGCLDINECDDLRICKSQEFCLNSMGSYKCMPCDRACKGCYGDSRDMCRKCAKGYLKKGDMCVKEREDEEMDPLHTTRYMTYLGLLVAGGVLYPRAPGLAAAVGALTLSYIAAAEYYCRASGHASILDLSFLTI